MDFKKNLYWIVLGAIVLLALIAYPMFVTDVEASASAKRDACDAKVHDVHKLAQEAGKDDAIKTEAHVTKSKDYRAKVESQIKELTAELKKWTINVNTFSNDDAPPTAVIPFDEWLSKHRDNMYKELRKAQISFKEADFDKLTFKDNHTMDVASTEDVQRPYRIRRIVLFEEVLNNLLKVHSNQDVTEITKTSADPWWTDAPKTVPTGVLSIDSLKINDPKESWQTALKNQTEALTTRSGRVDSRNTQNVPHFVDLPYKISTVEVDFQAPMGCVPGIVKALENSEKYHAVVTKLDVTRASAPFPTGGEAFSKAGPENPLVNSYYREGPMKVSISFDIYEYDQAKGAEFDREVASGAAPAAPAAAAPAKH